MNLWIAAFFLFGFFINKSISEKHDFEPQLTEIDFLKQESKLNGKCLFTDPSIITHLRLTHQINKVLPCIIEQLIKDTKNGWIWSVLGNLYDLSEEKKKGSFCFNIAENLSGKFPQFIREWHFLGPFVIGKGELDGDPVEAFGGIEKVSQQWAKNSAVYFSELAPKGKIKWTTYKQQDPKKYVAIQPEIQWGELIQSLGSMAITEWQGWVVGEFAVNSLDVTILIQCLGVHTIFVDGMIMTGDIYQREEFKFAVYLHRGIHSIKIKLRAKVNQLFRCHLEAPSSKIVLSPRYVPDLYDGHLVSSPLAIPVINTDGNSWLTDVRVSLHEQPESTLFSISQSDVFAIAPGQVRPVTVHLINAEPDMFIFCDQLKLILKVSSSKGAYLLPLNLHCRKRGQSFIFTFLDHDNSVQQAAAVEPLEDCPQNICPTLLTLHGTTISPRDQADSYKRMFNRKYVFGLEKLWTLAPTRHGAHNWEGPGALTAITALHRLEELTTQSSLFKIKSSSNHVIFAGHSMGGHGALILGTHYSDRALAVISLAGWIKKEEYGDSNEFFRHDIGTSFADPSQKAILQACFTENDVDRHISNLQDVPVFLRIGAADRTVHPYFVRRLYRLLKELRINVTYIELPNKEHWWWDTWEANDGGAVNDPQIRKFALEHANIKNIYCKKGQTDCGLDEENKYTKETNEEVSRLVSVFNPASTESAHGVKILHQIIPFRQSHIHISRSSKGVITLSTINVQRVKLTRSSWLNADQFQVDGTTFQKDDLKILLSDTCHLCHSTDKWSICENSELNGIQIRNTQTLGPSRRIAEQQFVIVTGTKRSGEMTNILLKFSVYLANLFYLTSDTLAPIINDTRPAAVNLDDYNVILIGGPLENSLSHKYIRRSAITYSDKGFQLGNCLFNYTQMGALFLVPHNENYMALILMGNNLSGLEDVIRLATPTIPPMTRSPFSNMIPDFIITGPQVRHKGAGGFLCAGFWGNHWEYRSDLSTCAC